MCNSIKVAYLVRVAASLLLTFPCPRLRAQLVTGVPNSLYSVEGNTNSIYPFAVYMPYSCRYQQVYDASQFSLPSNVGAYRDYFVAMTNGGWISDLFFRFDGNSRGFSALVSNVEIHLSTTQRQPDGLSSVFSDNVGSDDAIVFSGSFYMMNSGVGSPEPYESHIPLNTSFWYNPQLGNLLLDVRIHDSSGTPAGIDAVNVMGDSVSSVYSPIVFGSTNGVNATSGTTDTTGLVTFFEMSPPPLLVAYVSNAPPANTYIVLHWIHQPAGFVLQESTSLGSNAAWSTVVGADTPFVHSTAGSAAKFFRLARPGGP